MAKRATKQQTIQEATLGTIAGFLVFASIVVLVAVATTKTANAAPTPGG
jgi:hypothetical protein